MSKTLTDEDLAAIKDVLKQISGQSASTVHSLAPSSNSNLNGLNKPPKGTKIIGFLGGTKFRKPLKQEQSAVSDEQIAKNPLLYNPKMSSALQHKMMRLAKLNLLGAHASTEGPLGYENKPANAVQVEVQPQSAGFGTPSTGLNSWNRMGRAPEDVVRSTLDANYVQVRSTKDITSENRIKLLISSLRSNLTELNIPSYEFLTYFEEYLNRLIKDMSWISITASTALFMAVSSEEDSKRGSNGQGSSKASSDAWYNCPKCKFCYPPQQFPCVLCNSTFKSVAALFAHNFESHNNLVFQSFQCELCNASFGSNPIALKTHYNTQHFCAHAHLECPYGCKTLIPETGKSVLNKHIYTEHLCRICGDLFGRSVADHQKQFHSIGELEGNPIVDSLKQKKDQPVVAKTKAGKISKFVSQSSHRSSDKSRFGRRDTHVHRSRSRSRSIERRRRFRSRSRSSGRRSRSGRSRSRSKGLISLSSKRSPRWEERRSRSRGHDSRRISRFSSPHGGNESPRRGSHYLESSSRTKLFDYQDNFENESSFPIGIRLERPQRSLSPVSSEDLSYSASQEKQFAEYMNMNKLSDVFRAPLISSFEKRNWPQCADCVMKVPPPGTFTCHICSSDFELPSSLYSHVEKEHGLRVPSSFDCEFCSKVFDSAEQWEMHTYGVHLCTLHRHYSKQAAAAAASDAIRHEEAPNEEEGVGDLKISFCTECPYSSWKGRVTSEPRVSRSNLVSSHFKCKVLQCPFMYHSIEAASGHFETDKRCARYRLNDNLSMKHCINCALSMNPLRILCSYCPPDLCEYTNEHELLDHILSIHFADARLTLVPMFTCDFCSKSFEDCQFGLYMAHLSRDHKLCPGHKFCDDSLECDRIYPRDWKAPCRNCNPANALPPHQQAPPPVQNSYPPISYPPTMKQQYPSQSSASSHVPATSSTYFLADSGYFKISDALSHLK